MGAMKKITSVLAAILTFGTLLSAGTVSAKETKSSPQKNPALPLQYVLQDIHGNVMIRDKKTGKLEKAQEEQTLFAGDEIITQSGAKASLTLNKNTMVHISEKSDVKVDKLTRQKEGSGFLSRLKLLGGKILSEVEKLGESKSTFEISSGGVVCGVRGTAFEVETKENAVQTNTYHGVVEVQKGGQTQKVGENQNVDFAFDQDTFLPKRTLTREERDNYQRWLTQKAVVERKFIERQVVLDSIANLSDEDQNELLQKLDEGNPRDRLKNMRELLQNKFKQKRESTLRGIHEDAAKKRDLNNRLRLNKK